MFAMRTWEGWCDQVYIHPQHLLPNDEEDARKMLGDLMDRFLDQGGEGVIIRNPNNVWTPKRVRDILKAKPWKDAEGTVVGYTLRTIGTQWCRAGPPVIVKRIRYRDRLRADR